MPKKLWIQDIENAQKLFYELKEKVIFIEDCCDDNCEFLEDYHHDNNNSAYERCSLFTKTILSNKRCKRCIEIFGE